MAVYINPTELTESMAVATIQCCNCLEYIDIGDTCYIDTSKGIEETKAKIYCEECIVNLAGLR